VRNDSKRKPINKFNLVISIVLAFAAWFYVIYNTDPQINKSYDGVPVIVANEEALTEQGLAIRSMSAETVKVTLQGKRSRLTSVKPADITVTVNASDLGEGENTEKLTVAAPEGTEVRNVSTDTISIIVEERTTKSVPTRVSYSGAVDTEPFVTDQSDEEVEVSGAKSFVKQVAYADLPIDPANMSDGGAKTFSIEPVPKTSSGKYVRRISVNPSRVSVTVQDSAVKEVPLSVSVTGQDSVEGTVTWEAPETIRIKGSADALSQVEAIDADPVDLSGVTGSVDIPLTYELPYGISVANDSTGLVLKVTVKGTAAKEVTIAADDIDIAAPDGYDVIIDSSDIKVNVTGTSSELGKVEANDFKLEIDAKALAPGSHSVVPVIKYKGSAKPESYTLKGDTIKITVKEK
jgi:YbbR domain-containing protein